MKKIQCSNACCLQDIFKFQLFFSKKHYVGNKKNQNFIYNIDITDWLFYLNTLLEIKK
jgi:hypothetical protein